MEWLIDKAGADIKNKSKDGRTVWDMLRMSLARADTTELESLLKVMTLLVDVPAMFTSLLSPSHADLVEKGRRLRPQLPAFLKQQSNSLRMSLVTHCPLPAVLQPLIAAYAEPMRADIWNNWLPIAGADV
jgi:hypothetical protein